MRNHIFTIFHHHLGVANPSWKTPGKVQSFVETDDFETNESCLKAIFCEGKMRTNKTDQQFLWLLSISHILDPGWTFGFKKHVIKKKRRNKGLQKGVDHRWWIDIPRTQRPTPVLGGVPAPFYGSNLPKYRAPFRFSRYILNIHTTHGKVKRFPVYMTDFEVEPF